MGILRTIIAFVIAAIVATLGMSLVSTHNVVSNLAAMGHPVPIGDRPTMYLTDFIGFAPLAGIINALGLAVAFGVATLIIKKLWKAPAVGYPLAGGVAVWAELSLMHMQYEQTVIAGARTTGGFIAMVAAGVLAGLAFFWLTRKNRAT
ncbi:MAG: hypothetical protein EP347_11870 [Alphaproteobacteria bacterium]|nr:MAG: hypothetical protein EP347_11870 [Alphaproteobacteria bacterium]